MKKINLIKRLEKISSTIPNRLLKLEGHTLVNNLKEQLEIIIFKGFSSSTTHQIETDLEKRVIESDLFFTNFKLYKAPLNLKSDNFIKESQNSLFFLKKENWF